MNRAERIFHLHQAFRRRRPLPRDALLERLEISPATFKRDLGYMRDFMGAPVIYDRSAGGYRYDPRADEFELPGLWFNQSELYALLAAEQLLEAVQPGLLGPHIGPLKARIRALLDQSGHAGDTVSARILIRPAALRPVDEATFAAVAAAVLGGQRLALTYHGRERSAETRRQVHPQRLMHYRDNWFLIAWCESASDLRTFALDRIRAAEPRDGALREVDPTRLDRHLRASFGIFTGEAAQWAVLRFSAHAARWVADEIWHPDQIGQWRGGSYELQIPYSDPRELLMEIQKYGPEVEVLAPETLREAVARRVEEAAALYRASTDH